MHLQLENLTRLKGPIVVDSVWGNVDSFSSCTLNPMFESFSFKHLLWYDPPGSVQPNWQPWWQIKHTFLRNGVSRIITSGDKSVLLTHWIYVSMVQIIFEKNSISNFVQIFVHPKWSIILFCVKLGVQIRESGYCWSQTPGPPQLD